MNQKNNANNENKKKLSFSDLLNNKKFVLFISCFFAFVLWAWVSMEKSPETQRVIASVPVQINLENSIPEQLGLKVFGNSEFTVDVTVKGKKYIISSLDADDIDVVANTNYVDSSGIKTLQLKVTPKDSNAEYTIASSSLNHIEVYFDTYKEVELPIESKIDTKLSSIVPDGCLVGDTVFSKNTVLISGPTTEINKIVKVYAKISVDEILEKTTTFDPVFEVVTNDNSLLEYVNILSDEADITVTIPVLKEVVLPTRIEFRNAPSYFINNPLDYSVYPSKIHVAVPVDLIETTEYFVVDTIDFADISGSLNTFIVPMNSTNNSLKILDENIDKFTVKIDASNMVSKTITIPSSKITVKNSRDDYNVAVINDRDIAVKVIGVDTYIDSITVDNLSIIVDTTEQEITEKTSVLLGNVVVSGDFPCWAVGNYDVKVKVKPLN